jgi:hypothetical protein
VSAILKQPVGQGARRAGEVAHGAHARTGRVQTFAEQEGKTRCARALHRDRR